MVMGFRVWGGVGIAERVRVLRGGKSRFGGYDGGGR